MTIISRLSGRFQIAKYTKYGITKVYPTFDNIVTDIGLNQIGIDSFLTHCYVGSGNSTPIPSQSGLDAQVGSPTTNIISQSAGASQTEPYYGYRLLQYRFAIGTVTGNLSEVGVGWADALFSRALILDEFGDPVSITVLENEGLLVTYLIRNYVPTTDTEFTVTINGEVRNCVLQASNATSGSTTTGWGITGEQVMLPASNSLIAYDGLLGTIFQSPNGIFANSTTGATAAYVNNSHEIGYTGIWNLSVANFASGIRAFFIPSSGMGAFQCSVDPPIMKTDAKYLSMSFKILWSRL